MNIYHNRNRPYTYLIGWSKLDMWYYGVRYAKNCLPDDLWVTYFTSSKYVSDFRKLYGEPDVLQIRKIFDSKDDAIEYEQSLIKRAKLHLNERYLNMGAQKAFNIPSHILAKKISALNRTLTARERSKQRMLIDNPMKNPESRKKSSSKRRGIPNLTNRGDAHPMRKNSKNREHHRVMMLGRVWCNDGMINKFVKEIPDGFNRGRL